MPAEFGREDYYEQVGRIQARIAYLDSKYGEDVPRINRAVREILTNASFRKRFDPMDLSNLADYLETSYMYLRYGGHQSQDPAILQRNRRKGLAKS